jgi:hypothetical protein
MILDFLFFTAVSFVASLVLGFAIDWLWHPWQ